MEESAFSASQGTATDFIFPVTVTISRGPPLCPLNFIINLSKHCALLKVNLSQTYRWLYRFLSSSALNRATSKISCLLFYNYSIMYYRSNWFGLNYRMFYLVVLVLLQLQTLTLSYGLFNIQYNSLAMGNQKLKFMFKRVLKSLIIRCIHLPLTIREYRESSRWATLSHCKYIRCV